MTAPGNEKNLGYLSWLFGYLCLYTVTETFMMPFQVEKYL